MAQFINEVLTDLQNKSFDIASLTFILPNKRAGLFIKKEFAKIINKASFSPITLSIEEFTISLSQLRKLSSTDLLFEFYNSYSKITPLDKRDSFEVFSKWAPTLIQDFNEIDRFLVNPDSIFNYISAIKKIESDHWSLDKNHTALIKNHIDFWDNIKNNYNQLTSDLLEKGLGYDGLIYRSAVENLEAFIQTNTNNHLVFLGFNALNKSESIILQELLQVGMASVYWDLDDAFITNPSVSHFISKYKQWNYYKTHAFNWYTTKYKSDKTINVIGVSKNVGQAKYVGQLLSELKNSNIQDVGLVLSDETLLLPTLTSIPKQIEKINVTMGLPIMNSAIYTLLDQLLAIHEKNKTSIYYTDLIEVITHQYVTRLFKPGSVETIVNYIRANNVVFVSIKRLLNLSPDSSELLILLFQSWNNVAVAIEKCKRLILNIKDTLLNESADHQVSLQYLYKFHSSLNTISTLNGSFNYIDSIKALRSLFNSVLKTESVDFQGEPLEGLQIMGMLETRVLDFETVIITSVNEGILPAGKTQNSFIPFDVKLENQLPTYSEKDAIYAYHFYRLIQYAKNIYLVYNTEPDVLNGGEKSRFITQLEIEGVHNINHQIVTQSIPVTTAKTQRISKTKALLEQIESVAKNGFSPTALTLYIRNPIDFYHQYILKIKQPEEVEETIAANTLGTVVHETLKDLYTPLINQKLTLNNIEALFPKIDKVVQRHFEKVYMEGDYRQGKNLIIYEVAKRYVQNFLSNEIKLLEKGNSITVLMVEHDVKAELKLDQFDFPISLKGQIDRVDLYNDTIRIIDYKTGRVEASQVKINEWSNLLTDYEKYSKSFQVLFYAYLLNKKKSFQAPVEAGIISFKNLDKGFIKFTQQGVGSLITNDTLLNFEKELLTLIHEIFNPEIDFIEKIIPEKSY